MEDAVLCLIIVGVFALGFFVTIRMDHFMAKYTRNKYHDLSQTGNASRSNESNRLL